MQIKVNKNKKQYKYKIKSWSDVTLDKWVKLVKAEKLTETKSTKEIINIMSDMPKELIDSLSLIDVTIIIKAISNLQSKKTSQFKNIIQVGKQKYGFIPNLEELTLGEYADIEHFIKQGIESNMHKIMSVLYRPITETEGEYYSIEAYDNTSMRLRSKKFLEMKAEQVEGALVFFWTLGKELLTTLQLYLSKKLEKAKQQLTKDLQTNGVGLA